MIYIGSLKSSVEPLLRLSIKKLSRQRSTTLVSDVYCELEFRFLMVPVQQVIEGILHERWTVPLTYTDSYQIRNFTVNNKRYLTLFKQDSKGNRLMVVLTSAAKTTESQGGYFGYSGDAEGFFTMINKAELLPSDFEYTLKHKIPLD